MGHDGLWIDGRDMLPLLSFMSSADLCFATDDFASLSFIQIKFYLLKTHHISMQQVVKAVDEQGQQGSKEHLQLQ